MAMSSSTAPAPSLCSPVHLANGRCAFATKEAFERFEKQLADERSVTRVVTHSTPLSYKALAVAMEQQATDRREPFLATFRSPSRLECELQAAHKNVASRGPFQPPSCHSFRDENADKWRAGDFCTKFALDSTQDLRRRVALDQEGFFSSSPTKSKAAARLEQELQDMDKPEFQLVVPHTTSKHANLQLQMEKIKDQQGLLPQLTEVRSHKFRDDDDGEADQRRASSANGQLVQLTLN